MNLTKRINSVNNILPFLFVGCAWMNGCLVEFADIDPELDLLLDNSVRELDKSGISSIRAGPGEVDLCLGFSILVGNGSVGVGLVAVNELADGVVNLELADERS